MMREEITRDLEVRPSSIALWFGALAGPISFLVALQIKYTAVAFVCRNHHVWIFWVTWIAALALTAGAGFNASRYARSADDRVRFMALADIALCLMSALAVIALGIPLLFFSPCD